MRAVQITEFGGPEVLTVTEVPDPEVVPGQLLVNVTRAGINYADTHQAENSYLAPQQLPLIPGAEVVGTTADGRRVVGLVQGGGYAEKAAVWPMLAFDVPDAVSDGDALAVVLQGMTAWHLLRTSSRMQLGESVVVIAAAGGVGSLAVQLAKKWGAGRVIATASSEEKRQVALDLGADVALDPDSPDLKSAIEEANGGKKVDVVLEMTGGPVFDSCLAALAPFGRLVAYGMAGRVPPQPVDVGQLMGRSRAVIGFWLAHCMTKPQLMTEPMGELMGLVADGSLKPIVGGEYAMSDVRRAHEDLRARRTTGKLVLDPTT